MDARPCPDIELACNQLEESERSAVQPIVERNVADGRFALCRGRSPGLSLTSYVLGIAGYYRHWGGFIRELRVKDSAAQETLWRDLLALAEGRLLNKGVRYWLAREWAADIAWLCWHAVVAGQARYPFDVDFTAWLSRIVIYKTADYFRWLRTQSPSWRDWGDRGQRVRPENPEGLARLRASEAELVLATLLRQLPSQRDRRAVVLRYLCGLSVEETARALDSTPRAVYNRCYRACDAMRRSLESQGLGLADLLT